MPIDPIEDPFEEDTENTLEPDGELDISLIPDDIGELLDTDDLMLEEPDKALLDEEAIDLETLASEEPLEILEDPGLLFELGEDPVRLYLREIGSIDLLDNDREFWLSTRLEAVRRVEALIHNDSDDRKEEARVRFYRLLFDDLLACWKKVKTGTRQAKAPPLDLRKLLDEAQMLRQSWNMQTQSYVRNYLDNGRWGEDKEWDNVARNVYFLFIYFYLLPEEACLELKKNLQLKDSLPVRRKITGIPLDDKAFQEELESIHQRGAEAHNAIIRANLRLVVSVAKRYIGRGSSFLDLIQEGNIGLLRAVSKFDPARGFKFSTYATWWIRQSISRSIADQARTIRIPVHIFESINRLLRIQRRLLQRLGREPASDEMALEAGLLDAKDEQEIRFAQKEGIPLPADVHQRWIRAATKVERILRAAEEPMSLESPVGTEDNSQLGDFIEDEEAMEPLDAAVREMLRESIRNALAVLSDRERQVLELRFGLVDGRDHTLEEVGQHFNVTRERIRQIESKALRKLRHPTRSRHLRDFLA